MKENIFSGACTALVTPFLDQKINLPMAEQLLRRQIDNGIHTVIVAGTTGEAPTLSDNEKLSLIARCKSYAGNSCQIIAGTGSNNTEHAVSLSLSAQEAGADGILVVSPYYNKATPNGLYVHYWTIAQAVDLPVILYNVPSRTGVDIPVSVYEQLSKIQNIAGVKEAGTDIQKIGRIRSICPSSFQIWSGNDSMTVPIMALGGTGVISVASNLFPREIAELCSAAASGDYRRAAALQIRMQPLLDLLSCEVNPMPVKYAMKMLGFDCGNCRLPLTDLTQENKEKFREFFA